ncbi:MAG: peptidylprolyl isomerase [Clostridia bacterium]|nr:peptidylprolyl isomerase [Clostridia bacterium]
MKRKIHRMVVYALALTLAFITAGACLAPAVQAEDDSNAAILVNGQGIARDLVTSYHLYILSYFSYYYGMDATQADVQEMAYEYATQNAVIVELLRQKAGEMQIILSPEEIRQLEDDYEAGVEYYAQSLLQELENPTEENRLAARQEAENTYAAQGYSLALMLTEKLGEKVRAELCDTIVSVTDEDIQAYYDSLAARDREEYGDDFSYYEMMKMYWSFYGDHEPVHVPSGVRGIKHILLEVSDELLDVYRNAVAALEEALEETERTDTDGPETDAPENPAQATPDVDAAREAILKSIEPLVDEIMSKFHQGEPFDALVAEYGQDPGMREEPYKTAGYYLHLDAAGFEKAFKEAAFSQLEKPGDISGPVVTAYGVHILYYDADIPQGAPPLTEEARAKYGEQALAWVRDSYFNQLVETWLNEAVIEFR